MDRRLQLQVLLSGLPGVKKAYYQAPANTALEYPCIMYALDNREVDYANNNPYRNSKRYQVTVIDKNPDSLIPDAVAALPLSSFATRFTADNLHHEVFNLYF